EPGSLGAATLVWGQAPPQWITAVQPNSRYLPRPIGIPIEVFPPTKPPPISAPEITFHQRTEQEAHFLRTYHPDVDISFELLKDELQLVEETMNSVLDPYAGNRLAHFSMETQQKQLTTFVAFACGVTGSELNVSAFGLKQDNIIVFNPSAASIMAFDTPIQQIVAFSAQEATSQNICLLAVRTHAVVTILKLQSSSSLHARDPPVVVKTVIPISISETGKRRIVSMSCGSFSSSNAHILLVNDMGAVYHCQIQGGSKDLEDPGSDRFWRLAWRDTHACMRASSKRVHIFDLRSRTAQPRELFRLNTVREYVTSLEAPLGGRHAMCFATTSQILWYDERNSKRPIFSIKHRRAFDRSLHVESIKLNLSTLTTLSSAANHLVTVYDVNHESAGHYEMHGVPSLLPGSSSLDLPIGGSLICQPPGTESQGYFHFQLSSRGSLWKTNFSFSSEPAEHTSSDSLNDYEWTDDMHALAKKGKTMTEDIGSLGERAHAVANLRGIYQSKCLRQSVQEDAEAVYQTLEKMPFFWQDMNGATEHMLTTFDVAFQSGSAPAHASRADFLTESLLSTTRGFRALVQGRIPIPRLLYTAPWSYDLSSLPIAMVPDIPTPRQALFDKLRNEALAQASTPKGMQRATEATQSLVLDLALSRHVYAPQGFANFSKGLDGADMLSQATQALSLGLVEPPPLQFGFLRPTAKTPYEDDEQMANEDNLSGDVKLEIPLGVRFLLSQWDVGSSPEEYTYKDPYVAQDTSLTDQAAVTNKKGSQSTRGQTSIPAIATARPQPPMVVSTMSRPELIKESWPPMQEIHAGTFSARPPRLFTDDDVSLGGTQPTRLGPNSFSQDLPEMSTQPLPGPFGGNRARKTVVKKRLGGF
ncbi:hypothetical protein JB92DRAFT_2771138, partial [Gautieria morchelliformis]